MSKGLKTTLTSAIISAGLFLSISLAGAAEAPSPEDIIKALKPQVRLTRGLSTAPMDKARVADEARFVDSLRNRPTRSLSTEEREKVASLSKSKPNIDLEINFEYNSDILSARGLQQVTALGKALASEELKGATFVVAGHTDAKGSDTYNQGLSERRADAVKRFLKDKYGIENANLVTVGHGKSQLKNAEQPLAAENRRVQVVNMVQ
jgi:outer membrane protein OmpA-like peptidoglycan-associated protein